MKCRFSEESNTHRFPCCYLYEKAFCLNNEANLTWQGEANNMVTPPAYLQVTELFGISFLYLCFSLIDVL